MRFWCSIVLYFCFTVDVDTLSGLSIVGFFKILFLLLDVFVHMCSLSKLDILCVAHVAFFLD